MPITIKDIQTWNEEKRPDEQLLALTDLLIARQQITWNQQDASDLRQDLEDIFRDGRKGYNHMTQAELLQEIDEQILCNDDTAMPAGKFESIAEMLQALFGDTSNTYF